MTWLRLEVVIEVPTSLRFIMFLMQDLGARFMWTRETGGSSNWILPTAPPTQGMICDGIIKGGNTGGPSLFLSVKVWNRSHLHNFINNPWGTCWAETYMFCSVFPIICTCLPICSWESLYAEVESTDSSAYCQGSHLSYFQLWDLGSNFSGPHFIIFWSRSDDATYLTGQPRATVSYSWWSVWKNTGSQHMPSVRVQSWTTLPFVLIPQSSLLPARAYLRVSQTRSADTCGVRHMRDSMGGKGAERPAAGSFPAFLQCGGRQ